MGGAGILPSPGTPVRSNVVHESGRTRITWLVFADGT
jgi:hypothetical protein